MMERSTKPLQPLSPEVQAIFTAAANVVVPTSAAEKAIGDLLMFAEMRHRALLDFERVLPGGGGGAAADVLAERRRQVDQEGWTAEHDDQHSAGEMAWAAACYALIGRQHHPAAAVRTGDQIAHETWPWALQWFKPTERRRDLVKAAALLLAEIERLDRVADV